MKYGPEQRIPKKLIVGGLMVVLLRLGTGGAGAVEPSRPSTEPVTVFRDDSSSWQRIDNPRLDGWQTEAFSDYVESQLKQLGQMLSQGRPIKEADLVPFVVPEFTCAALVPKALRQVFRDGVLEVERSADVGGEKITSEGDTVYRGAAGLASAIEVLIESYQEFAGLRVDFKLVGVERSGKRLPRVSLWRFPAPRRPACLSVTPRG